MKGGNFDTLRDEVSQDSLREGVRQESLLKGGNYDTLKEESSQDGLREELDKNCC